MDKPQNIFLPTLYAGHPALISWDTVDDVEGYSLERSVNDGPFQWAGTSSVESFRDVVPANATTVTYRVQAFNTTNRTWDQLDDTDRDWDTLDALDWTWFSEWSEFTVSDMALPIQVRLNVPTLHAGYIAQISWTGIQEATGYLLERKLNTDTEFKQIYSGSNNQFTDIIPESSRTIAYRISWYVDRNITWDEFDDADHDWDHLDSLDWRWHIYDSLFTTAGPFEVIPNRTPVISGQDSDLGTRYRGFSVTFSVTDPDPANTIHIVARLNGAVLFNMPNAQQGATYTANITDAQIFAMADQSRHSVTITATDNKGLVATRTYTFTAVEDLVTTAVFYVLRNGVSVAKLGNVWEWTDYLEVGTHRYVVRGVDRYGNFSDSNEVTVTITLKYGTLALVSSAGNYIELIMRRNERPRIGRNYNNNYTETWYEGRAFPIYEYSGQKRNVYPISFTTLTLQEQSALFGIVSSAQPLIYRDQYNNRVIGVAPDLTSDHQGRLPNQAFNAIIDFDITINQSDFNEVIEYD